MTTSTSEVTLRRSEPAPSNTPVRLPPLAAPLEALQQAPIVHAFQNARDAIAHAIGLSSKHPKGATRIVVYSGQFDPFHRDHLKEVQESLQPGERALVVPMKGALGAGRTHHAAEWLRMAIARASTKKDRRIQVDNYAIRQGLRTAPALLVGLAQAYPPGTPLAMLMGSDNFAQLHAFVGLEDLLEHADLIVNFRPGHPIEEPLECIPEALRGEWTQVDPTLLVNMRTQRRIELRASETTGLGSHDVIETILGLRGDDQTVFDLMTAEGAAWANSHFYPDIDVDRRQARFMYPRAIRAAAESVLGDSLATWMLHDSDLLDALSAIPADASDHTAQVAGAILEAGVRAPGGLPGQPHLYSLAVALATHEEFRAAQAQYARPPLEAAGRDKPTNKGPTGDVALVSRARELVKPAIRKLMAASAAMARVPADDIPLTVVGGGRPTSALPPDQTVRVFIGIQPGANLEQIKANGLSSKAERRDGRAARDALLEADFAGGFVQHVLGDSSKGLFVSASLSPNVAKSYAGEGGLLVTLDVPAAELIFCNDPQQWSGTFLRKEGNPERYLHEVLLDRVPADNVAQIDVLSREDLAGGFGSLGAYVSSQARVLRAALRGAIGRLGIGGA